MDKFRGQLNETEKSLSAMFSIVKSTVRWYLKRAAMESKLKEFK